MTVGETSRSLQGSFPRDLDEPSQRIESGEVEESTTKDTRKVELSRTLIKFLFLTTSTVFVALSYAAVYNKQRTSMQETFLRIANSVQSSVGTRLAAAVAGGLGLSEAVTVFTTIEQNQWPWVTLMEFELIAKPWRQTSHASLLGFLPLIDSQDVIHWEIYSSNNHGWVDQSFKIAGENGKGSDWSPSTVHGYENMTTLHSRETGPIAPLWQTTPLPANLSIINYDALSEKSIQTAFGDVIVSRAPVLHDDIALPEAFREAFFMEQETPHATILSPIFSSLEDPTSDVVGLVWIILEWGSLLGHDFLAQEFSGVQCVFKNSCGQDMHTYEIQEGGKVVYLGSDDLHDRDSDRYQSIVYLNTTNDILASSECTYAFYIYPTKDFFESFYTTAATFAAASAIVLFAFTAMATIMYENYTMERTTKIMEKSVASNTILSTLFPHQIRERLFAEHEERKKGSENREHLFQHLVLGDRNYIEGGHETSVYEATFTSKPIADLFPHTTIMFADIVGFTAWSSARDPAQVFALLENIFRSFDEIADVAVVGLPQPRSDHAAVMARFATNCVTKMLHVVKLLEVELGPDTSELAIRVGLHSGQVTAGVLRGKRARLQLFGDAMNTASRMESTSYRNKIQISQETADLLTASGKGHWFKKREKAVEAKGKGKLQTYWLTVPSSSIGATRTTIDTLTTEHTRVDKEAVSEKKDRLVGWCVEVFRKLLKEVKANREVKGSDGRDPKDIKYNREDGKTVLEEVVEVITLPSFSAKLSSKKERDPSSIQLSEDVERELYEFVSVIASRYPDNSFHNFGHVAHVLMSVTKLLSRIVAPAEVVTTGLSRTKSKRKSRNNEVHEFMSTIAPHTIDKYIEDHEKVKVRKKRLHDHTYGITSDPLTQLACVFSALIHDVDHRGVPNSQLVKEEPTLAAEYKNQSVAEQLSVDIAWNLLMSNNFAALRGAIYSNETEMMHFRRLVVNSVMATDIMDKDLKALRNSRWEKAFSMIPGTDKAIARENINRKATIVIEHIIQASDVAHTMQHWHIYRTWNEHLFREMSLAYRSGRSSTNPAQTWYEGELGFFDFYIIPLAKKLKECGVFGVSSAEYLNYALLNRQEWEIKGKSVVAEMIESFNRENEIIPPKEGGGTKTLWHL